jgi:hypothetical protein
MHLAHINIGTMRGPIYSEVMRPFREQIGRFNALADSSPGFVWRLQTESGDTADIDAFGNDRIFITLSVWESLQHLFDFTYRSGHVDMFRRRREWITEEPRSQLGLWWIEAGGVPTIEEAKTRLESVARYGPTPFAFTFKKNFPPAA